MVSTSNVSPNKTRIHLLFYRIYKLYYILNAFTLVIFGSKFPFRRPGFPRPKGDIRRPTWKQKTWFANTTIIYPATHAGREKPINFLHSISGRVVDAAAFFDGTIYLKRRLEEKKNDLKLLRIPFSIDSKHFFLPPRH